MTHLQSARQLAGRFESVGWLLGVGGAPAVHICRLAVTCIGVVSGQSGDTRVYGQIVGDLNCVTAGTSPGSRSCCWRLVALLFCAGACPCPSCRGLLIPSGSGQFHLVELSVCALGLIHHTFVTAVVTLEATLDWRWQQMPASFTIGSVSSATCQLSHRLRLSALDL